MCACLDGTDGCVSGIVAGMSAYSLSVCTCVFMYPYISVHLETVSTVSIYTHVPPMQRTLDRSITSTATLDRDKHTFTSQPKHHAVVHRALHHAQCTL